MKPGTKAVVEGNCLKKVTVPFEFSFSPFCPVCLTSNLWLHGSEVGKLWHNGSEPTEKFSRIHNLQCNLTFTEIFCSSFSQNVTITLQFQINFLASRSNKQTNCLQLHSNSVSHLHIKRGCDRITCSVTIGKTKYPSNVKFKILIDSIYFPNGFSSLKTKAFLIRVHFVYWIQKEKEHSLTSFIVFSGVSLWHIK